MTSKSYANAKERGKGRRKGVAEFDVELHTDLRRVSDRNASII